MDEKKDEKKVDFEAIANDGVTGAGKTKITAEILEKAERNNLVCNALYSVQYMVHKLIKSGAMTPLHANGEPTGLDCCRSASALIVEGCAFGIANALAPIQDEKFRARVMANFHSILTEAQALFDQKFADMVAAEKKKRH